MASGHSRPPTLWPRRTPIRAQFHNHRLHITHPQRILERDEKLWRRESDRARLQGRKRMRSSCTECGGFNSYAIGTCYIHLMRYGRHPQCRLPTMDQNLDSSDDEWIENMAAEDVTDTPTPILFDGDVPKEPIPGSDLQPVSDFDVNIRVGDMINELFADIEQVENDHDLQTQDGRGEDPNKVEEEVETGEPALSEGHATEGDSQAEALRRAFVPLYPGSKLSKLSFVTIFLYICGLYKVSNRCVDALLFWLKERVLPSPNEVPPTMYLAKRLISVVGLNYTTIEACPEGCVLFRKDYQDSITCPKCGADRYKDMEQRKLPTAKLRHFPLISRFQRMYKCRSIAELMTWAPLSKSTDGKQRHAADSVQWQNVDRRYPDFASDPRNLRLGLAVDGVNPYKLRTSTYSCWPVMIVNYNLPPWLQTKRFFIQLSLVIPGPLSPTGKTIDVYLEPLVEELQQLWTVVPAWDSLGRGGNARFTLRAVLLWTINDYPALGLIAGQCHGGKRACVVCGAFSAADWSKACGKPIFLGYRRWLPRNHPYRGEGYKNYFVGGVVERRPQPDYVTARHILAWAEQKKVYDNSGGRAKGPLDPYKENGVARRSILFDLPYWENHFVRHLIDVMHLEKNVCHSLVKYLLGQKDTIKVRNDMQTRGFRCDLWFTNHPQVNGRTVKPAAPYVLLPTERTIFLSRLQSLKVPTGFSSAWAPNVSLRENKLIAMKSHDYHILMQQILMVALRGLLPADVRRSIQRLSNIFRRLCAKVQDPAQFAELRENAAVALCELEMHFPPAFFDVMPHLIIHAIEELEVTGPVSCRWMSPIERQLGTLKGYVRTRARPEASMCEGYVNYEVNGFSTEYLNEYSDFKDRVWDSEEDAGVADEVLQGAFRIKQLSVAERDVAHAYVLNNKTITRDWLLQYESLLQEHQRNALRMSVPVPTFPEWFKERMLRYIVENPQADSELVALSSPPSCTMRCYRRMKAYGNHFRVTGENSRNFATYDSGIAVIGDAPRLDLGNIRCSVDYVGELVDIVEFDYGPLCPRVILMKGKWVRPRVGQGTRSTVKRDQDGYLLVDFRPSALLRPLEEPFVFPCQVEQVFFVTDRSFPGWRVVVFKEARSRRVSQEVSCRTEQDWPPMDANQTSAEPHHLRHAGPETYEDLTPAQREEATLHLERLFRPTGESQQIEEDDPDAAAVSSDDELEEGI